MEIVLNDCSASDAIEIVRELRALNLVQGKDFDFSYSPATRDNFSYEGVDRKHTKFTFYDEKWGSLFSLKYGHKFQ